MDERFTRGHGRTRGARAVIGCDALPPLLGHVIAVTGHRRIDEISGHFESLGAEVLRGPMLRTRPIGEQRRLRAATRLVIGRPPEFLIATTGIGLRGWFNSSASYGDGERLRHALRDAKILARGPKVVGAVSEAGLHPWFVEPSGRTDPMIDLLTRQPLEGAHVVLQLPGSPMDDVVDRIRSCGASVTAVGVYDWSWPEDLDPCRRVLRAIANQRVSAVTFTSRPAVRNFVELAVQEGLEGPVSTAMQSSVVAVCVGEVTADALRTSLDVAPVVAERPMLGAVVQATAEALARDGHHHVAGPRGEIVVQRRLVMCNGESVMMSDREAQLLAQLLAAPRRTLGRDELLAAVWWDEIVDPSVLETTMARLRRRLSVIGLTIRTINGRGYLLDGEQLPCLASSPRRSTIDDEGLIATT